jgi:glycopeptide antibiotics resistance protein
LKKLLIYLASLGISFGVSYLAITWLIMPVLLRYRHLVQVIERFDYTEISLIILLALSLWLFIIQYWQQRFSTLYLYLVYTCYLFLLFTVLFIKSTDYQALSLNPFDFLKMDRRILEEAALNMIYFIPLGGLYGMNATPKQFVLIVLATLLGIETLQFIFYLGTFAISDILLNFLGCLVGYICCQKIKKDCIKANN